MSLLPQPLFSTSVRTGITRPHLISFPWHLQAAQRGTWNLAPEQLLVSAFAGDTQLVCTIVSVLVMAAPSMILVPNVWMWNPSSNRYLIISPSSGESLSAQLSTTMPNGHDASIHLTQRNLRYVRKFIFSDGFLNSRLTSFPTAF